MKPSNPDRFGGMLTVAFLAYAAEAHVANACSDIAEYSHSYPSNGCVLETGNRFVLYGRYIGVAELAAQVNGAVVALEEIGTVVPGGKLVRVSPNPEPGAELTVVGDACPGIDECDLSLSFPIAAQAPAIEGRLTAVTADVYDWPAAGPAACGEACVDRDLVYYVRANVIAESGGLVRFQATPMDNGPAIESFVPVIPAAEEQIVGIEISLKSELFPAGDPLAAFCFAATLEDFAGAVLDSTQSCAVCRARVEEGAEAADCDKPEPAWTDADLRGDASCAVSAASAPEPLWGETDGECPEASGDASKGCVCASSTSTPGFRAALPFVLLIRRRRHHSASPSDRYSAA